MSKQVTVFDTVEVLCDAVARYIAERAQAAVAARDSFSIALSGGSTPRHVYRRLAAEPLSTEMPWAKTYVFSGDERAVPLDSPDSNYRMALEALFQHVPIPTNNVKPMLGQGQDLDVAAQQYERTVRSVVPGDPPRFDLVLLGMGPDGHTASLFPYSPALAATDKLVVATPVAPLQPHVQRITFTQTLINAAADLVFLVAGADKARTLADVLEGQVDPERLPAQLIAPTNGELHWMLDRAAAQELTGSYG